MAEGEIGALDRFVRTRGVALTGASVRSVGAGAWYITAGVQAVAGLGALTTAAVAGPSLAGFAFPGVFMLFNSLLLCAVGRQRQRMTQAEPLSEVKLNAEAERLVRDLTAHLEGWPWRGRFAGRRERVGSGPLASVRERSCEDVLAPPVFALLSRAAFEYNRIQGSLAIGTAAQNATLQKLGPNIRAAAAEAMADLLQLAALLQEFPESAPRQESQSQAAVEELRELADQVDRVQAVGDAPGETVKPGSRLREVLTELRAHQLAQQELGLSQPDLQEQQLQQRS